VTDELFDSLPLLVSVPEAAKILGVSRSAGYRLTHTGELLSRRLGGRIYVVTQSLRELCAA
jgi:excisionase family DNA binding protein